MGGDEFNAGTHSFNIIDRLYRQNIKKIDNNLNDLQPILKPQASDLYYDRKVELTNLVENKKQKDKKDLKRILEMTENIDIDAINKLKEIMRNHDIKHPLRGEG